MQIAALAYEKLTAQAKARVDALIKLNPDYQSWVGCLSPEQRDKLAFIRASAWADDIKTDGRHTAVGDTPTGADAGRNVGYADNLLHGYWQSMQTGFSTDEAPVRPPDPVNALTQIRLFTAALQPSSGVSDAIRSYDLVWLVHLVADAHQPLHAARRFTQALASSDQGGNKVLVKPDAKAVERAVKKNEWNEYVIRCEGKRIRTWLNGEAMIDYTEPDDSIEQFGLIGVQIHGGGPAEASYKEITIEELP